MRRRASRVFCDKTRPSRVTPFGPEVGERIVALTLAEPPGETTHWTGRAMAKAAGVSLSYVQRTWRSHGLQPHRIRTFKLSNDPHFAAKVRDIVGLYVDPPAHAVVLSIDEKSQIQAHGELDVDDGCPGHDVITQLDDDHEMTQTGWLTDLASRARVGMQTSSHEAAVLATAHGGGLACLACFRANREAGLIRVHVPDQPPSAPIWLMVHKDNRDNPRIRVVLTHITESIRDLHDRLDPVQGT